MTQKNYYRQSRNTENLPHEIRMEYLSLDGNWVHEPLGFCSYHHRFITQRQMKLHRCMVRHGGICHRFRTMKGGNKRKMVQEKYYDRQLDQLKKIETSLNKLVKTFENISNFCDMMVELYREESISKAEQCKSNDMIDDGR